MAPLLLSYGQDLIDEYHKQIMVEEYIAKHGIPGSAPSTPASPIVIADDADLSVHTDTESESVHDETTIDPISSRRVIHQHALGKHFHRYLFHLGRGYPRVHCCGVLLLPG